MSAPVADVVELYSAATRIAESPEQFVAAIEDILAWSPEDHVVWQQSADALLAAHDWNQIVAEMGAAMDMRRGTTLPLSA